MKILHVNTLAIGGAAKACFRLHEGLLKVNVESFVLTLHGQGESKNSYCYSENIIPKKPGLLNRIGTKCIHLAKRITGSNTEKYNKSRYLHNRPPEFEAFHFPETPYDITLHPLYHEVDILHFHWVAGFLDYPSFFRKNTKPLVWTLHDMHPFTGGCHYTSGCSGYKSACEKCPQLKGTIDDTYTHPMFLLRQKSVQTKDITIVSPSRWLENISKESVLLGKNKHFHIANGIDTNLFKRQDKAFSRKLLGLSLTKQVILFVADTVTNTRKGFQYLLSSLDELGLEDSVEVCVVGRMNTEIPGRTIVSLGMVKDDLLMTLVYSAADVFIVPSLEDNLPNTVVESLCCGTPVIGFPVGGIVNMIKPGINGLLCADISSSSLTNTIKEFLATSGNYNSDVIRTDAIHTYNDVQQAKKYKKLYDDILNGML